MLKGIIVLIFSLFIPKIVYANNVQSIVDAFTKCDNSFFYQLKNNQQIFNGVAPLIIRDKIAYISVKDIENNENSVVLFTKPINYKGLNIVGYQNVHINLPPYDQYYYWGFIINNSPNQVRQTLKDLPWQQYNAVTYIANPQIYDYSTKTTTWKSNPYTIDNVLMRLSTVEKLLYLEPSGENQAHMFCSIQGDITDELLNAVHPDIQYIKSISEQIIEGNEK